jgi:hypothetical protein
LTSLPFFDENYRTNNNGEEIYAKFEQEFYILILLKPDENEKINTLFFFRHHSRSWLQPIAAVYHV